MDDLFALVGAGKVDTVSALKVIEAFKVNEESYVVWSSIINCLGKLKTILCDTPYYSTHYKPYVLDLLANIITKVGWEKQVREYGLTLFKSRGCPMHSFWSIRVVI